MGIPEEVQVEESRLFSGAWTFYDMEGKRFLFNYRGDVLDMHATLTNMSRDERKAFADVYNKLELANARR